MFKITKTNPEVVHNKNFGTYYRNFYIDETEAEYAEEAERIIAELEEETE